MVKRTWFPGSGEANGPGGQTTGNRRRRRQADLHWAAMQRALGAFGKRLPELREDLSCYAAVQADRARLAASNVTSSLVSGILQIVAIAAIFATAASLLIVGIAGGLASALHGNLWLADLITGAAALLALGSAIAITVGRRKRTRMRLLQRRYRDHEARDRAMADAEVPGARQHAERT